MWQYHCGWEHLMHQLLIIIALAATGRRVRLDGMVCEVKHLEAL